MSYEEVLSEHMNGIYQLVIFIRSLNIPLAKII